MNLLPCSIKDNVHRIVRFVWNCVENRDQKSDVKPNLNEIESIMNKALYLAHQDLNDLDAIREIGQGWVAEETLAIAVYCTLKYPNDFIKVVTTSVNHDGDSDSTGAVTGNIMLIQGFTTSCGNLFHTLHTCSSNSI